MNKLTKKTTVREILQQVGTEFGRSFSPNIWVNALFSKYKPKYTEEESTGETSGSSIKAHYPNWIITDMRFPNELKVLKKRGGISIRVERPKVLSEEIKGQTKSVHPSETALDDAKFDYVIYNNGTIEDLVYKVKEILIKENII